MVLHGEIMRIGIMRTDRTPCLRSPGRFVGPASCTSCPNRFVRTQRCTSGIRPSPTAPWSSGDVTMDAGSILDGGGIVSALPFPAVAPLSSSSAATYEHASIVIGHSEPLHFELNLQRDF